MASSPEQNDAMAAVKGGQQAVEGQDRGKRPELEQTKVVILVEDNDTEDENPPLLLRRRSADQTQPVQQMKSPFLARKGPILQNALSHRSSEDRSGPAKWRQKTGQENPVPQNGTGTPLLEGGGNVNSDKSAVVPASQGRALLNKPGIDVTAAVALHTKDNLEMTTITSPPRNGALALASKPGTDDGPAERMLKVTTVPLLISQRTVNSEVKTVAHNTTGAPLLNSGTMAAVAAPQRPVPHSGLRTNKAKPGISIDDAGEASKATGIPLQKVGRTQISQTTALALPPQTRAPDGNTATKPDAIHR
ncbi:hypothetical protein CBR_g17801 [Chara braunii]|uniref:Uncharacterized protein n=1 Tax=Chara braunii TaxID=69332 RepID=A0A388KVJ0_CHABU|nr:hypothetical protein CBR_g17801 [Chara braunii]|eukprot:GBG74090.1 hypothetical protein CBR_g17801 [Chara braunii]